MVGAGVAARTLSGSGDKGEEAQKRGAQMLTNYENAVMGAQAEMDLLEAEAAGGSKL